MTERPAPRLTVEQLPPDWEQLPERLILELEQPINEFRAALEHTSEHDYSVDNFLNEIILVTRAQFIQPEAFDEFLQEISEKYSQDAPVLVPALAKLGKSLLSQLQLCRAYSADGLLHYWVDSWLDAYTPVLVKLAPPVRQSK